MRKIWTDPSKESNLSGPVSKRKRATICKAGGAESFVNNALLLCGTYISKCYMNYHENMNGEIFKSWFGNKLETNLLKDRKALTVLDNAKYLV